MVRFSTLAALVAVALGIGMPAAAATDRVIFTNETDIVGPGIYANIFSYDPDAVIATPWFKEGNGLNTNYDYVSWGAKCGNNYLVNWASEPMNEAGVVRIDLSKGQGKLTMDDITSVVVSSQSTLRIPHSIACDPKDPSGNSALVFLSRRLSADSSSLSFELHRFDLSGANPGNDTLIGTVPSSAAAAFSGWDSAFSFTGDGQQLWAAFTNPGFPAQGANLVIMDTTTGAISTSAKVNAGSATVYTMFPPKAAIDTDAGGSFGGVISTSDKSGHLTLTWATFSLSGSSVGVSTGAGAQWIYNIGTPCAICNGVGYASGLATKPADDDTTIHYFTNAMVSVFDPQSGSVKTSANIDGKYPNTQMQAVACL